MSTRAMQMQHRAKRGTALHRKHSLQFRLAHTNRPPPGRPVSRAFARPHTKKKKTKAAKYFQQIPTEKFPLHPARSLVSRLSCATPLQLYHRRQNAANHTRKHRQTRAVVVHNPCNASSCGTCGVNRPRQPIPHTIHSHLFLPPPPHTPHAAPFRGESAYQWHQCPWHQSKTAGPPGGA